MTEQGASAPLTPAECDLTDFAFMPLDVARLRDSELASNETPEACWAAVLLWAASWHQVPAASIPNDEKWIAKAAGYAARGKIDREWNGVRDGALRGFVLCDDGRLYHPVVGEKAREAWASKLQRRWHTECARIKKHNDRHGTSHAKPTFEEWIEGGCLSGHPLSVPRDNNTGPSDNSGDKPSKGQGEGQGQRQGQGQSVIPSDPDGSAGKPAVGSDKSEDDPPPPKPEKTAEERAKADVWRAAVDVLQAGGCKVEATCRTFMGKLVGDYTFDIVKAAVAAAVTSQPAEAREYLRATCQRLKGERVDPATVASEDAAKTKARNDADDDAFRAQDPAAIAKGIAEARASIARRALAAVTVVGATA